MKWYSDPPPNDAPGPPWIPGDDQYEDEDEE